MLYQQLWQQYFEKKSALPEEGRDEVTDYNLPVLFCLLLFWQDHSA